MSDGKHVPLWEKPEVLMVSNIFGAPVVRFENLSEERVEEPIVKEDGHLIEAMVVSGMI